MKALLKDTRTDEIIVELADNLDEELTDDEVQNILEGCNYDEEDLEYAYVCYE